MTPIAPMLRLVRAVGTVFVRRILRPVLIIATIVTAVLHAGGIYLVILDSWWWMLEGILIVLTIVGIVLAAIVLAVLHFLEPRQTSAQKELVSGFVDKLERVAENIQTPLPLIALQVARDVVRPRADGFIETISRDSQSLAPDFIKLKKSFETPTV